MNYVKNGESMLIYTQISPRKILSKQNFGHTKPDFSLPASSKDATEVNLNNIPSVQNKVLIQPYKPDYKEIQTFEVPSIGQGKMYQLKNGHKVIILPKPGTTNIITYIKVGGYDEPARLRGISHLLEHLSCPYSVLGTGVESNGETAFDLTSYYVRFVPKNTKELEKNIKIQSKLINGPTFSDADLERERAIVLAEVSNRKTTALEQKKTEISEEDLFGKGSIKQLPLIGTKETINAITKNDLIEHYNKFYTPENMVMTIVGEVEPEETIQMVSRYFNSPPRKKGEWESNLHPDFSHSLQVAKRTDLIDPDAREKSRASIKFAAPSLSLKEKETAFILEKVLNQSEAFSTLKDKLGGFPSFEVFRYDSQKNSPIIIEFSASFEEKYKKELKTIYDSIHEVINTPIKDNDFKKIKAEYRKSCYEEESSFPIAQYLGKQVIIGRDADVHQKDIDLVDSITKEDVENFAKKYIDLNKASLIVTHPEKKSGDVSFGQKQKYVEQYELSNNATVVVDTTPGTVKTKIKMYIGSINTLKSPEGPNWALADMMRGKATKLTQGIDNLSIESDAGNESMFASVYCEASNARLGIKHAKEVLLAPEFDKEKFEKSQKSNIEFSKIFPEQAAFLKEDELFGDTHLVDLAKNMSKVTPEDAFALHKKILSDPQVGVVITMPAKDFAQHKNEILNELNTGFPPLHKLKLPDDENKKSLDKSYLIIDTCKIGEAQAKLKQSYRIYDTQNAKDIVANTLLSMILADKILEDLREKQGITYTPSAYNDNGRMIMTADADVSEKPENIKKILESFDKNTRSLMQQPISEEELESVKNIIRIKDKGFFESSYKRNSYLLSELSCPYGIAYQEAVDEALEQIRPEHIQCAAQLIFAKPCVTTVIASNEAIEPNKEYLKTKGERIFIEK